MADDLAALLEEQQRRQGKVTGGYTSVLEKPQEKPAPDPADLFSDSDLGKKKIDLNADDLFNDEDLFK